MYRSKPLALPRPEDALPGRAARPFTLPATHAVNGRPLEGPWPEYLRRAMFGMGCFWGAERRFWQTDGVWVTAVGYAGGFTPHPTYAEVCTGMTGHNEVVLVLYDPDRIGYADLLRVFFESHDPTQGMRQGNDVGTQYRSGIYVFDDAQDRLARRARDAYGRVLADAGLGPITTEILPAPTFYYAEGYHQQYLAKNPAGYCGLGGTGHGCPTGLFAAPPDGPA